MYTEEYMKKMEFNVCNKAYSTTRLQGYRFPIVPITFQHILFFPMPWFVSWINLSRRGDHKHLLNKCTMRVNEEPIYYFPWFFSFFYIKWQWHIDYMCDSYNLFTRLTTFHSSSDIYPKSQSFCPYFPLYLFCLNVLSGDQFRLAAKHC